LRNVFISYEQAYGPPFEDMMRCMPSMDRIRQAIGYKPGTTLDQILKEIIAEKRAL